MEQDGGAPATLSQDDRLLLRRFKFVLALIAIGLLLARTDDWVWPIVTWPMYDDYGKLPPGERTSTIQLRVLTSAGETHIFWDETLFTTVPSGDTRRMIEAVFEEDDEEAQRRYFALLVIRARARLPDADIVEVQAWRVRWQVNPFVSPPFDQMRPDAEELLGSFHVADVEAYIE